MIIGQVAQDDLLLRDVVTGQLYRATEGDGVGLSYLLGVDGASVFDSNYLPFYGATYLSEEFEGQTEGQVLGSLKLNFNF